MTEVPARLSIVTLGVRNMGVSPLVLPAAGLTGVSSGDDAWTGFLLGGGLLALFTLPDLTAGRARQPRPDRMVGLTREEVDTIFAAAAAGATAVADATEGNRWEITWSPRATFDARGALLSWD
jgi:uncharacterized protein